MRAEQTQKSQKRARPRRDGPPPKRVQRSAMWLANALLVVVTLSVLATGALVFYLNASPLTAPDWVREKIEAQLAEALPQAKINFSDMILVMEDDWQPRLGLRNVVVRAQDGQDIVRLNEIRATFAAAPLFDGEIRPRRISLLGITAQIDRDSEGAVRLSAVAGGTPAGPQAANLPALIAQLDGILEREALSLLESVDLRALTLRYEDARARRAWTVDGGRLLLRREGAMLALNADLAVLSGGAGVATLSANYRSEIGASGAQFGVTFEDVAAQDIAAQGPAFEWLGVLQAPISGAVRAGLDEEGAFTPIAATLQIGEGAVQPTPEARPIPFQGGRSYFTYDPPTRVLEFDELSVESAWVTGRAAGAAVLGVDEAGTALRDLVGQIALTDISANPGGLYDAPIELAQIDLDFRLSLNPFEVTLGRAQIADQGRTLMLKGGLSAGSKGWQVALDGRMDALDPPRLLELWPTQAATKTREWLDENLIAGDVTNVDFALRRGPDRPAQTYVAFDYSDATVRFANFLPPVTGARGHFSIAEKRLVITVDDGIVTPPNGGAIATRGSSFIIPDVTVRGGAPSVVRLQTRSTIEAALSLLNLPPLSVMDKANLPVALADGRAELVGTLDVPLKAKAQVGFGFDGTLAEVESETLVQNRTLRAPTLRLKADNAGVEISGAATLDDVPFEGQWVQPLGPNADPAQVTGDVSVTAEGLEKFGVSLPPGTVSGRGSAQLEVTFDRDALPSFRLASDLTGVGVSVPEVSWRKTASEAGLLEVEGAFGTPARIESLRLEGPGLSANGTVDLREDGALNRVRFNRVQVGNWLDVPLDLIGRGAGRPFEVVLRGGAVDLRRASFGQGSGGGAGAPLSVALDRLQITDAIALTDMRGQFATSGGLDGRFEARLNGAAPVQGRVVPQGGRSAVRLQSVDAGSVLRAAGLLRQVAGGSLSLVLLPVGSGGAFDGQLTASDVRVLNAPGIAALLNAVSVVGLVNELNGDGIYFDDVEATFRLTPKQLTLTKASAVGSSMGLSMDGTYALDSGRLALQGVVSPVYLLNSIGSIFTRRGEGLIGFNYNLGGTAQNPEVSVNPLSALTPAMFREIFRAPPPELPAVDGVTESVLPKPPPTRRPSVERRYEGR